MSAPRAGLEERCGLALRRHLAEPSERTLGEAYDLGRAALAQGVGLLEAIDLLSRAVLTGLSGAGRVDAAAAERAARFVVECVVPFEMAVRGAGEVNAALRAAEERLEDQARRIAHELHDEAGQLLATVHLALEDVRPHLRPGEEGRLDRATALLRRAEDEIRRVAHELRPSMLEDLGLMPALRFLGDGVARRTGLAISVEGSLPAALPDAVEISLYRAVQEALANAARHAAASSVSVRVRATPERLECVVRDDGRGFEAAAPRAGHGLGLAGIRDRVQRHGGTMILRSEPGTGTELTLRIPLGTVDADPHAHR